MNNILVIQEVSHFLEYYTYSSSKMMIKVDIEKVYDMIKSNVILVTLKQIKFS